MIEKFLRFMYISKIFHHPYEITDLFFFRNNCKKKKGNLLDIIDYFRLAKAFCSR